MDGVLLPVSGAIFTVVIGAVRDHSVNGAVVVSQNLREMRPCQHTAIDPYRHVLGC